MPDKLKAIMLQKKLNPPENPYAGIKPEDMAVLQRAWGNEKLGLHDKDAAFVPMPGEGDWVSVNHPPQFHPDPKVIARPNLDRAVQQLLTVAPTLKTKIKSVQDIPGATIVDQFATPENNDVKWRPWDLDKLNLLGLTGIKNKDITINPRLTEHEPILLPQVLLHEATHATGFLDEEMPQYAESTIPNHFPLPIKTTPTRDQAIKRLDDSDAMFDEILNRIKAGQK